MSKPNPTHKSDSENNYFKHGMIKTPEHRAWEHMKQRCYNPKCPAFKYCGARGTRVAPEWQINFLAFYEYVGPRPSSAYSLDRIDTFGNYEPGNVRWATREQQGRNRTINNVVTYRGERMAFQEAWERSGKIVSRQGAWNRYVNRGWPIEAALETPPVEIGRHKRKKVA